MSSGNNNWCETCEEVCNDHTSICTTCGDTLTTAPSSSHATNSETDARRQANEEIRVILSSLGGQTPGVQDLTRIMMERNAEWEQIPTELLQPQNAPHRGRPTAKAVLDKIPRITLDGKSSLFRQGHLDVTISGEEGHTLNLRAVAAEFGKTDAFSVENVSVIVGSPKTAKGGLSPKSQEEIASHKDPIVYLERGDGVTFVFKALEAQKAGASAVVIGNNMSSPWPYVMKDSKDEASQCGLSIPVVMLKQEDGKGLTEFLKKNGEKTPQCILRIESLTRDCAVCCEKFGVNDKVMRLPECDHCFHETCALPWLTKHNTCPFCRRELPTDDEVYEAERRRTQRTHAGSSRDDTQSQWNEFYG